MRFTARLSWTVSMGSGSSQEARFRKRLVWSIERGAQMVALNSSALEFTRTKGREKLKGKVEGEGATQLDGVGAFFGHVGLKRKEGVPSRLKADLIATGATCTAAMRAPVQYVNPRLIRLLLHNIAVQAASTDQRGDLCPVRQGDILEAHLRRRTGVIYAPSGIRKRDGSAGYWTSYSCRKIYPGPSLTPLELASPSRYDRPPAGGSTQPDADRFGSFLSPDSSSR
ncbi:hypothetical protein KM043_009876 [Ampulex compressa]|nr:hypothetical protein KM043_009876 [Ampulex compressa]